VLTPTLAQAAPFKPAASSLTPWYGGRQWSAPAPATVLPRVEVSGTREGEVVTIYVRSPRRANRVTLAVRGGTVLRVNGIAPAPQPARKRPTSFNGWSFAIANASDTMTVEVRAPGALEVIASDLSFGFWSPTLTVARETSNAVPQHDGDVAITRARMKFASP